MPMRSANTATSPSSWEFEVTPYLFASGLNGTVGARGIEADVDASFSDIWENLDIGLMGLFLARRGPWTLTLDGVYFKVSDQPSKTVTGPFGQVSVTGALDVSASVTVLQPSLWYRVRDDRTKVDLGAGLRYTRLDLDLDVKISTDPGIVFPGGRASFSGSESWVDLVFGAQVTHPISHRWSLMGYADLGGGGSSTTYQVLAGANWTLNDRFTAKAGYRYVYWDYEDDGVVWDISASGPSGSRSRCKPILDEGPNSQGLIGAMQRLLGYMESDGNAIPSSSAVRSGPCGLPT